MIFNKFPTFNQVWPGRVKGWRQKLMSEVNKGLMFPETRYPVTMRDGVPEFTIHLYQKYTAEQLASIAPELALAGWEVLKVKEFFSHTNLVLRVIEIPAEPERPSLHIAVVTNKPIIKG